MRILSVSFAKGGCNSFSPRLGWSSCKLVPRNVSVVDEHTGWYLVHLKFCLDPFSSLLHVLAKS